MNPNKATHYHVNLMEKEGKIRELLVTQMEKNSWEVIDYWGDLTGKATIAMKTFTNGKEAVEFAINELNKKFKGTILTGAGCPPDSWIREFDK